MDFVMSFLSSFWQAVTWQGVVAGVYLAGFVMAFFFFSSHITPEDRGAIWVVCTGVSVFWPAPGAIMLAIYLFPSFEDWLDEKVETAREKRRHAVARAK